MAENPEAGTTPLRIEASEFSPAVWEVRIIGAIDWSNFAKVEAAMGDLFQRGCTRVIVNLKETKYISSAGLGCFINSLDTVMKNGGNLIFASTPPEIRDIFNILGFANILRFADTPQAALAQLE